MRKFESWAQVLAVTLVLALIWSCGGPKPPLVDQKTLKTWLSDPRIILLDVRAPKDWRVSNKKIPGAVRQDPNEVKTWAANLPKDQKIVLY